MSEGKRKPGRPRGKSSDPNYTRLSAYIKKVTNKRMLHLTVELEIEISEAVEQALQEWVEKREREARSPSDQ